MVSALESGPNTNLQVLVLIRRCSRRRATFTVKPGPCPPEPGKESSMRKALAGPLTLLVVLAIMLPVQGQAQSFNGSISGKAMDTTGAALANSGLVLSNLARAFELCRAVVLSAR